MDSVLAFQTELSSLAPKNFFPFQYIFMERKDAQWYNSEE